MAAVYRELKKLASRQLRREFRAGTLETTGLVHEAYLRLAQGTAPDYENRAHFFGIAARVMRQVLVDHARARTSDKRGGGAAALELDEALIGTEEQCQRVLELNEALERLAAIDERKARVVELRWFAGLEVGEAARALGVSENTVIRDWSFARAWLEQALRPRAAESR
jgi:RNA polymerase sigma factor (TIGR02999 family)